MYAHISQDEQLFTIEKLFFKKVSRGATKTSIENWMDGIIKKAKSHTNGDLICKLISLKIIFERRMNQFDIIDIATYRIGEFIFSLKKAIKRMH